MTNVNQTADQTADQTASKTPGPRTRYARRLAAAHQAAEAVPAAERFALDRTTPAAAAIDEVFVGGSHLRLRDREIQRLRVERRSADGAVAYDDEDDPA